MCVYGYKEGRGGDKLILFPMIMLSLTKSVGIQNAGI